MFKFEQVQDSKMSEVLKSLNGSIGRSAIGMILMTGIDFLGPVV